MDKLTQFLSELFSDADKLAQFNSGSSEAEITTNRQTILNKA